MAQDQGKVWLVGAGPGDPGLITVRGLSLLSRADVVLYDALAHPALLEACPAAERRNVGKRYGEDSAAQTAIIAQMIELARTGKRVVRLKGGDPLMFARGAEEALALSAAGISFEIVPGVSSPVATSAYAGISLTHRELSSSVTFITGSDRAGKEWSPESWKKLATATDTICVLMGMRRIVEITQAIIDGGRAPSTPAAVIHWGARPEQRVITAPLNEIAEAAKQAGLKNPAIIIVGEVVRLREKLSWYDSRPLSGKRLVIPRAVEQARETAAAVRERGAAPLALPMIEITDPPDPARLARAVAELSSYDWVLLTSSNGVERLRAELERSGRDARVFGSAKVGAIGPKTAQALERLGVRADVVAQEFVGEELAAAVLAQGAPRRALLLRALVAREALPEALRARGCEVDVVAAYQTRPLTDSGAELAQRIENGSVDAMLFTSSSTVTSTLEALGSRGKELLGRTTLASIGPVTTKTLEALGLAATVQAQIYTVEGLLDALERHFAARPRPLDPLTRG
ncbi:MAG TPA: uroporphyrinogen-III C-methyltransferase [Polyangiaceae bacterium]|nr:uroporphyrinogen-III C-methyltransferase [Polyangiaceae bacterium]